MKINIRIPYNKEAVAIIKSLPPPTRKWNPEKRCWSIEDSEYFNLANKLRKPLPIFAKKLIFDKSYKPIRDAVIKNQGRKESAIKKSKASSSSIIIPCPEGKEYFDFQKAGIDYMLRRKNSLLADEMGLGKTIQAIGVMNYFQREIKNTLIICPATGKINWSRELEEWLVSNKLSIDIAYSGQFPNSDIVIINYDIVMRNIKKIQNREWDLLLPDECHFLKGEDTQRTKAILGNDNGMRKFRKTKKKKDIEKPTPPIQAKRSIFITGTPIVNRPKELYYIANRLMDGRLGSFIKYAYRYCDAKQTRWGWDFDGASHLDELQSVLRENIMVRRMKKDVLKELPDKVRQVIELPSNGLMKVVRSEQAKTEKYNRVIKQLEKAIEVSTETSDEKQYRDKLKNMDYSMSLPELNELSKLRRVTSTAKVPYVVKHLQNVLEGTDKVVVFAHHHDVIDAIHNEFRNHAVQVTGRDSQKKKQNMIDLFQTNKKTKLFIGSIKACGVLITLTAASTVVFAELDWVPGNLQQAEDRLHRIGQKNSVLVQHLVLEGTIDAYMAKVIVRKLNVIDKAVNQ